MNTTDLPTTTTETPAPVRIEDKGEQSLLKKGDRVVIKPDAVGGTNVNGRHGTIENVETVTMRTIVLGMGGGPGTSERSHYYRVRTDGGFYTSSMSYHDLAPETEPAPTVIPDPKDEIGQYVTVGQLCRSLEYAHRNLLGAKAAASRARVEKSIRGHNESAETYRRAKDAYMACLDAWCSQYPEGRAQHAETIDKTLRAIGLLSTPKSASGGGGAVGGHGERPTMTENEALNGVELRFPTKPDAETIGNLKRHGWRWAMRSRCWYTRRSEVTLAFARDLAGAELAAA